MNKKGASPLVVTIILIAFAVALGTLIMNLGSSSVNLKPTCKNVELSFVQAFGEDSICYDAETLKIRMILENTGKADIEAVMFRHIKSNFRPTEFKLTDSSLKPGELYDAEIGYELPSKIHVEYIPIINTGDGTETCSENSLVVNALKNCADE